MTGDYASDFLDFASGRSVKSSTSTEFEDLDLKKKHTEKCNIYGSQPRKTPNAVKKQVASFTEFSTKNKHLKIVPKFPRLESDLYNEPTPYKPMM